MRGKVVTGSSVSTGLKQLCVALDAETVIAANFQYDSGRLRQLQQYTEVGQVKLLVSTVTVAEVEKKIAERVTQAVEAGKRFRDKARILRNATEPSFQNVFQNLDAQALAAHLQGQWRDYLAACKAEILTVDSVSPSEVFDQYFAGTAPFGPGQKKAEFPDAFTVKALEKWAAAANEVIEVVSGDADVQCAANDSAHLTSVHHLDELLERLAASHHALIERVAEALRARLGEVDAMIVSEFTDLGFYLADQEGEVIGVTVTSITGHELYVTDLDGATVYFEVRATVEYEAEVEYDDLTTASWDSEDKRYFVHHRVETAVIREEDIDASGSAAVVIANDEVQVAVERIDLSHSDIGVEAESWEDYK